MQCFVRCLRGLVPDIPLPNNTPVVIGRSSITQVRDSLCSKEQILLTCNLEDGTVTCVQQGMK